MRILIIEDDENISKLIQITLSMEKYETKCCKDGITAYDIVNNEIFDLILLDIMLPGMDGFELMKRIKNLGIPVIFLTAKQDVADKVYGLKLGAEDYIAKPFEALELLARIEVVFRRYGKDKGDMIEFAHVVLHKKLHKVTAFGEDVALTPKEFEVCVFFLEHKEMVIRKEQLLSAVWGYDFMGETRTVDTHVQQVRKKLKLQEYLFTLPKIGYCLKEKEK